MDGENNKKRKILIILRGVVFGIMLSVALFICFMGCGNMGTRPYGNTSEFWWGIAFIMLNGNGESTSKTGISMFWLGIAFIMLNGIMLSFLISRSKQKEQEEKQRIDLERECLKSVSDKSKNITWKGKSYIDEDDFKYADSLEYGIWKSLEARYQKEKQRIDLERECLKSVSDKSKNITWKGKSYIDEDDFKYSDSLEYGFWKSLRAKYIDKPEQTPSQDNSKKKKFGNKNN
ncbi:MAG: hypothetical protein FWH43_07730 [Endomicrobia bacterium]|nr:hypothetical protein [Endomicrobiia bacterium]